MNIIDRRVYPRLTVDMPAAIVSPDAPEREVQCMVRDQSTGGARLELSEAVDLPDLVWLDVNFEGERRPVSIRWRGDFQLGVMYLDQPAS